MGFCRGIWAVGSYLNNVAKEEETGIGHILNVRSEGERGINDEARVESLLA